MQPSMFNVQVPVPARDEVFRPWTALRRALLRPAAVIATSVIACADVAAVALAIPP